MLSAQDETLPVIGQVGRIPIALIRPFASQPRSYFDPQGLQELADSIKQEGQRTPAWVMPCIDSSFELIAGERRWRACILAGVPALLCEVREHSDAALQYIDSVMENFGRRDCTSLEAARAVQAVLTLRFGDNRVRGDQAIDNVAKVFAKSTAWVRQHLMLLNLHPDVQALLEPPQRISTQVAVALANLRPETQLSLAKDITTRQLRHKSALALVRNSVTNADRRSHKGRRRPSDDYDILSRFLISLGEQAQTLLNMPEERVAAMFKHRNPKDLTTVHTILNRRIKELGKLADELAKI